MTMTREVAKDVFMIDTEMYSIPDFTAVYLLAEEKPALIESGPATSAETVLAGIRQLGFDPKDIEYVIVTHIHLDHAGGAGTLLAEMPKAKVLVHPIGAKHLVDPSRLMASVRQVQGEKGIERDGPVVPIDQERVRSVADGETIELGRDQQLTIRHTPGHARYHICICDSKNRGLFTGDVVGILSSDESILIPTTPPPDFDVELCIHTVKELMRLDIEMLLFSHFGVTRKVEWAFQEAIREVELWDSIVKNSVQEGNLEQAAKLLQEQAAKELAPIRENKALYDHQVYNFMPVCAAGYMHYRQNKKNKS